MTNFFDLLKRFKLPQFLENEKIIMMQWENENRIADMTEEELINRFSLYMCHINDEMKEMVDAEDHETYENFLKEIIDVAMYTASAINLFAVKYKSLNGEEILDSQYFTNGKTDIFQEFDFSKRIIISNDTLITVVSYYMSMIREFFPQRKWHKAKTTFTKEEYNTVLIKSYAIGCALIQMIVIYASKRAGLNYDLVSRIINEKQRKIVGDALKTGTNLDPHIKKKLERLANELS